MAKQSVHVPVADIMAIASAVQFKRDKNYGDLLSAKQMKSAERIIRRLIREHLDGKWKK